MGVLGMLFFHNSVLEIAMAKVKQVFTHTVLTKQPRLPLTLGKVYVVPAWWGVSAGVKFRVYQAPHNTVNPEHFEGQWYYDPFIGDEEQRLSGLPFGPFNSEWEAAEAFLRDADLNHDPEDDQLVD
jgi:hypothetical protein